MSSVSKCYQKVGCGWYIEVKVPDHIFACNTTHAAGVEGAKRTRVRWVMIYWSPPPQSPG